MSSFILVPTVAFLVNTFVWSYVLGQRQQDLVTRSYLLLSIGCGGWIVGDFLLLSSVSSGYELLIVKAQSIFWIPTGMLFLNFTYALAGKRVDRLYLAGTVVSVIGVLLFVFTDWLTPFYESFEWGAGLSTESNLFHFYTAENILLGCYGVWIILCKRNAVADPGTRNSLNLILFGSMAAVFFVVMLNVVVPDIIGIKSIPRFGSSALVIFMFIVFLAVSKYRFMAVSADKVAEELFEELDDGIVIIDRFGEIVRTNHTAEQLMKVPEHRTLLKEIFSKGARNETIRLKRKSRAEDVILSLCVSDASYCDETVGKLAIIRDITEQIRAEEILTTSKEVLEKEVEKRVLELRHAQKMEAIGTLAGGIAHDFNNILAAISGFTHAALQELQAVHPIRSDLNEVIIASSRAREIVQQILTFSRPDEHAERRGISVQELLDEAMELLRIALPASISVETEFNDTTGVFRCDPTQISQVLMSLGTNAFYAMKETKGGVLTIGVDRLDADEIAPPDSDDLLPGPYARITFKDNGKGMTGEVLEHIFDPFFTTKKQGEGAGLGLSTALKIIRNHDGTIKVKSEIDKGTSFSVYLPVEEEMDAPETPCAEDVEGGTEHIMVVDDEIQLQRVSKRLLAPLGYRVTTFSNGPEALIAFKRSPDDFDLVITDHTMPLMTGFQLASHLLSIRPSLPVILLSGYGSAVSEESVRKAGIRTFLRKPVPFNILPMEIRNLLDTTARKAAP